MSTQLLKDSKKLYEDPLKGLFFLYGQHDTGKSTALAFLAYLLALDGQPEEEILKQFEANRKEKVMKRIHKKDAHPDMRVIVPYKGIYVYIALYGDSKDDIEKNVFFFEGSLRTISIFDKGSIRPLKKTESEYYALYPPAVCVSACFESNNAEAPLKYFADKKYLYTQMTTWLRIEKTPKFTPSAFPKKWGKYGSLLKRLIDECLLLPY